MVGIGFLGVITIGDLPIVVVGVVGLTAAFVGVEDGVVDRVDDGVDDGVPTGSAPPSFILYITATVLS